MLKLADYDSMSGEHVGTISGLIVITRKSQIWPLAAPENKGFGKMRKFLNGKIPRHFCLWIYSIWEEEGRCRVCWGNF
jgi:hypothetical protein